MYSSQTDRNTARILVFLDDLLMFIRHLVWIWYDVFFAAGACTSIRACACIRTIFDTFKHHIAGVVTVDSVFYPQFHGCICPGAVFSNWSYCWLPLRPGVRTGQRAVLLSIRDPTSRLKPTLRASSLPSQQMKLNGKHLVLCQVIQQ